MGIPRNEIQGIICLWGSLTGPQHTCSLFKEAAMQWRGVQGFVRKKWVQGFVRKKWELLSSLWQRFPSSGFLLWSWSVSPLSFSSVFSSFFCFHLQAFNIFLVVPYSSKLTGFPCFFLRMHLLSDTTIQHDKPQNIRRSGQSQNHCLVCIHLCIEIKTWASTSAFVNMI